MNKRMNKTTNVVMVSSLFVFALWLVSNTPAVAAPPDFSTCQLPNVLCVPPGGTWYDDTKAWLTGGTNREVFLTDQNLATEDDYMFPNAALQALILDGTDKIYGEGMLNTTIRRDHSNVMLAAFGQNQFRDFYMRDASTGITIGTDDYDNVVIDSIKSTGMGNEHIQFAKSFKPGNSAPNITISNCEFDGGQLVVHCNCSNTDDPITFDTKYPEFLNNTFRNITNAIGTGLVIDNIIEPTTGTFLASFLGNVMVDSDNNWTSEALLAMGGGGFSGGTTAGGPTIELPSNTIEWNVTGDTLADRGIGVNNREINPGVTSEGRAVIPTPAVDPIYPNGRIGAYEAYADVDGSNTITLSDFDAFRDSYNVS